jgi:hypothetical protein
VIKAFEITDGCQADKIAIPLGITRQHDKVVIIPFPFSQPDTPITGRDVGLHAENGFEIVFARELLEGPGAEHAAVIGERQCRHAQIEAAPDQVIDAIRPVKKRILAVCMKMYEGHPNLGS